jgi:16S rRNA (adenine1518-N6/adenine1519-N6)-dimethyltransferase
MVQKEAAERLTARRDTKERYPLGVALEVMGTTTLVRRVPPTCFRPAPRVDSALVEIDPKIRGEDLSGEDWLRLYSTFLKA